MAIEKKCVLAEIGVLANGILQVRWDNIIVDDGDIISSRPHRTAFAPGDDVSQQEKLIQDIATLVWTPEIIASYQDLIAI